VVIELSLHFGWENLYQLLYLQEESSSAYIDDETQLLMIKLDGVRGAAAYEVNNTIQNEAISINTSTKSFQKDDTFSQALKEHFENEDICNDSTDKTKIEIGGVLMESLNISSLPKDESKSDSDKMRASKTKTKIYTNNYFYNSMVNFPTNNEAFEFTRGGLNMHFKNNTFGQFNNTLNKASQIPYEVEELLHKKDNEILSLQSEISKQNKALINMQAQMQTLILEKSQKTEVEMRELKSELKDMSEIMNTTFMSFQKSLAEKSINEKQNKKTKACYIY